MAQATGDSAAGQHTAAPEVGCGKGFDHSVVGPEGSLVDLDWVSCRAAVLISAGIADAGRCWAGCAAGCEVAAGKRSSPAGIAAGSAGLISAQDCPVPGVFGPSQHSDLHNQAVAAALCRSRTEGVNCRRPG